MLHSTKPGQNLSKGRCTPFFLEAGGLKVQGQAWPTEVDFGSKHQGLGRENSRRKLESGNTTVGCEHVQAASLVILPRAGNGTHHGMCLQEGMPRAVWTGKQGCSAVLSEVLRQENLLNPGLEPSMEAQVILLHTNASELTQSRKPWWVSSPCPCW